MRWRSGAGPHGGARLHKAEGVLHRVVHLAVDGLALLVRQVEGEVDLVADVARLQPVERDAGHVGQQFGVALQAGVGLGAGRHGLVDGALVEVAHGSEVDAHGKMA